MDADVNYNNRASLYFKGGSKKNRFLKPQITHSGNGW